MLWRSGPRRCALARSGPDLDADDEIADKARAEVRIVLAMDLDFGDSLAASRGMSPSVIMFRSRNQTPESVTPKLIRVIQECAVALAAGAFIRVEDAGYRLRLLPIR